MAHSIPQENNIETNKTDKIVNIKRLLDNIIEYNSTRYEICDLPETILTLSKLTSVIALGVKHCSDVTSDRYRDKFI